MMPLGDQPVSPDFQGAAVMDRTPGIFPEIKLCTVDEFVEAIGLLFCVGRNQSEMLSLARSYSAKQDRYQNLVTGRYSLLRAMVGSSIYETEDDNYLMEILDRHFAHMQQLVSWLRSSMVYQSNSQGYLYEELSVMIAAPQLAMLLLETERHLEAFSPLKHVSLCLQAINICGNEPNRACKMLLRCLLNHALQKKPVPDLSFRKSLNSLDSSSSKFTSTQNAELKRLDEELAEALDCSIRRRLIDSMTGVYAAMMILNRLKKIMDTWSSKAFHSFTTALSDSMFDYAFTSQASSELAALNEYLLVEFYKAEEPSFGINHGPDTSPAYQELLTKTTAFSTPDDTYQLDGLFKKGVYGCSGRVQLEKLHADLQRLSHEPYFEGVDAFLIGLLALHDGDRERADLYLTECLSAAAKWPLGILEHHAALFCIGLAMSRDPGASSTRVNPLLSIYLKTMPQRYILHVGNCPIDTENFNLSTAISLYNLYCSGPARFHESLFVNPFVKIEQYLQRIFDWLDNNSMSTSATNLGKATRAVTTKRDIQRVRPYLTDQSLFEWLTSESPSDLFIYFPTRLSLLTIPSICRLLELGDEHRFSIAKSLSA